MTVERERRAAFLAEMGLGPTWQRRTTSPESSEAEAKAPVSNSAPAKLDVLPERVPAARPQPSTRDVAAAWDEQAESDSAAGVAITAAVPAADAGAIAAMGWDELEQSVAGCTRCGLCSNRARTVFGIGDKKARWLFVGEGPGREEDMRGEPFVGRAGQLLDNMLAALQLARGRNTYIANVVKCRPTDEHGKDRRPSADEIAACMPHLARQVALIQPDVIVALGKTAAIALLGLSPETPLAGLRGRVHRYAERPVIVTYHPAYLLRTPADKKKAWEDLCLALGEMAKAEQTAAQ